MKVLDKATALEMYDAWDREDTSPFFPIVTGNHGRSISTTRYENLLMFGSCDYLGLSQHQALKQAAITAIEQFGTNTYGAQLLCGRTTYHEGIEVALRRVSPLDAAIVFPSGMAANLAALSTLVGDGDVILADRTAHVSLFMGSWLSGAELRTFPHNNVAKLESMLAKAQGDHRRIIVVDGLYSADGDFSPLDEIVPLAKKYDAMVMVDEAHSFGAVGPHGLGVADHHGVLDRVDLVVGTMSKALGSVGGFILTSTEIERKIRYLAPSYTSSRGSAPAVAAATLAALNLLEQDGTSIRAALARNVENVTSGLIAAGLDVLRTESHIVPVLIGDEDKTVRVSNWLMDHGVFVGTFVYPHVPAGKGRLRVGMTSTLTDEECQQLVDLLITAKQVFQI